MGNCCECVSVKSSDNTAENFIRKSISLLNIRHFDYNDFHECNLSEFGIFLTEILNQNKSKFFVTQENYEKFLKNQILNLTYEKDSISQQNLCCLKYSDKFFDNLGINYVLSLWALAHIRNDFDSKLEFIFKILKDTEKFVNFKNFQKFLFRYVRINVNLITKNFNECEEIKRDINLNKDLNGLNKLYSSNLIEKYLNKVLDGLKNSLKLNNENLKSGDIDSEFLSENIIASYFRHNPFLLDIISLRESVFIYTKSITDYSYSD